MMSNLTAYLWGVASVLMLEGIVLMFVTEWLRKKVERDYTADGNYLYIKAHNPYVSGVVGTDIKLTFKQKIKILFCKGVCVCR